MNPYWTVLKPFLPYALVMLLLLGAYGWAHHNGVVSQRATDAKQIAALIADRNTTIGQLNADTALFKHLAAVSKANVAAYKDAKTLVSRGNASAAAQHAANDSSYAAWVKRYQKKLRDNPALALQLISKACEVSDLDY